MFLAQYKSSAGLKKRNKNQHSMKLGWILISAMEGLHQKELKHKFHLTNILK